MQIYKIKIFLGWKNHFFRSYTHLYTGAFINSPRDTCNFRKSEFDNANTIKYKIWEIENGKYRISNIDSNIEKILKTNKRKKKEL